MKRRLQGRKRRGEHTHTQQRAARTRASSVVVSPREIAREFTERTARCAKEEKTVTPKFPNKAIHVAQFCNGRKGRWMADAVVGSPVPLLQTEPIVVKANADQEKVGSRARGPRGEGREKRSEGERGGRGGGGREPLGSGGGATSNKAAVAEIARVGESAEERKGSSCRVGRGEEGVELQSRQGRGKGRVAESAEERKGSSWRVGRGEKGEEDRQGALVLCLRCSHLGSTDGFLSLLSTAPPRTLRFS